MEPFSASANPDRTPIDIRIERILNQRRNGLRRGLHGQYGVERLVCKIDPKNRSLRLRKLFADAASGDSTPGLVRESLPSAAPLARSSVRE